jgi:protein kinase C substrate 80K-H
MQHHRALTTLEKERQKHLAREKQLGDILNQLRSGYNPNYQDMAVLEAVRGWEYFAGLPHINDVKKDEPVSEAELGSDDVEEEPEEAEEEWTVEDLEKELPGLLQSDYESLLIEYEKHIGTPTTESLCMCYIFYMGTYLDAPSTVFDVSAYIPDALAPQYEALRDGLLNWLRIFGIVKDDGSDKASAGRCM